MNPLDLLNLRKMAPSGANRRPGAAAFLDMAGQTGQAPQGPMPSIAEGARLRALKALGATQQPTAEITKPKLITPTSAASGAGSLLPGRGTPGSAALGAFGQTMSQLGGWQDKPMTFGQIMGASLGKAREAYGTAEERQRQIAAEKAALEKAEEETQYTRKRQSMLDAITVGKFNIDRRKAARDEASDGQPTKPYEIYDVQTGRKKFVRDVRNKEGGWSTEDVGGVAAEKKEKADKPSSTLFTVNIPGENPLSLRADDPELDKYLGESGKALGARVTKAGQLVGSKDEVLSGLTKAEYSKQVVKAFDAKENIIRLENVKDTFDDNFLRLGGKIDLAVAKAADWGNFASKEQTDLIKRVSDWQLNAWNQVNDRIKAITGAQMSEAEAKRIMKELPDPTSADFFKISSPAEYKAKLERALENAKLAVARQQYFLSKGLEPSFYKTERTESNPRGYDVFYESGDGVVGLDGTKSLMKKEAADLAEKYKDLPYEERRSAIKSDMQSIFGLGV